MTWWNQYVGIPFVERGRSHQGVDCWGLVSLILHEIFAIDVPDLLDEYQSVGDLEANKQLYDRQPKNWRDNWQQTDKPEPGSVVVLRVNGYPVHVGLCVKETKFIHCWSGGNTTIEDLTSFHWRNRVDSIWRHNACQT